MKDVQSEAPTLPPIEYSVRDAAIAELRSKYEGLKIEGHDKAQYMAVRAGRLECVRLRGDVEKTRKVLKADALEYGRKVDAEAKRLTADIEAVETPLAEMESAHDAWVAEQREIEARQRAARVDGMAKQLAAVGAIPIPSVLATITDAEFATMLGQATDAHNARVEAERQAKAAQELADAEAAKKLAEEQSAAKAEADRVEAERKRNAEIQAAENARIAAENKARSDELAAQQAELNRQTVELLKAQAEAQRLAAEEAKAKADAIAKAQAEAQRLAMAPERERLIEYAKAINQIEFPKNISILSNDLENARQCIDEACGYLLYGEG